MSEYVTDPALLAELNGESSSEYVTDPKLLEELNAPDQGKTLGEMAPFWIPGQGDQSGHFSGEAFKEAGKFGAGIAGTGVDIAKSAYNAIPYKSLVLPYAGWKAAPHLWEGAKQSAEILRNLAGGAGSVPAPVAPAAAPAGPGQRPSLALPAGGGPRGHARSAGGQHLSGQSLCCLKRATYGSATATRPPSPARPPSRATLTPPGRPLPYPRPREGGHRRPVLVVVLGRRRRACGAAGGRAAEGAEGKVEEAPAGGEAAPAGGEAGAPEGAALARAAVHADAPAHELHQALHDDQPDARAIGLGLLGPQAVEGLEEVSQLLLVHAAAGVERAAAGDGCVGEEKKRAIRD